MKKTPELQKLKYRYFDIGYGFSKYLDEDGNVVKNQAVVAELGESLNDDKMKGIDVFQVDGVDYIIGEDVYKLNKKPITANERSNRAKNQAYKVLALYALAKTYEPSDQFSVLTGLPFQNLDEAPMVKSVLEENHTVKLNGKQFTINVVEAMVSSQGLGTFYAIVRQRGGAILQKKILICDLGFGTINYLPVNNGDIDIKNVKTNRDLGIQSAYKSIADAINLEFKSNYKFYDVDGLLNNGVPQQDLEKGRYFVKIMEKDYVKSALTTYATDVWTDILDKYDEKYREQLEEVIFAGGTSERVQEYLNAAKKHFCSFVEDPQDVQVLGYGIIGEKVQNEREKAIH